MHNLSTGGHGHVIHMLVIGHDNLIIHDNSNSRSIDMACSTFNASNSLLDIQPDITVTDTDMSESERKHTWLQLCGFNTLYFMSQSIFKHGSMANNNIRSI